jgi:Asp-tRNA(Asn)/Glu-tRNA(Gln) amidotransferase A subunit family amidase
MKFLPLTAVEMVAKFRNRECSIAEFIAALLDHIAEGEPKIQAWEYFDPTLILRQAERLDDWVLNGQSLGALHGVPVAIKDIYATVDMPTGWGTPVHQGTWLGYDAAVVEQLRAAGAIILGKTVTTEYATAGAGKTRNPHHFNHTPGGSSSGSAAAVAAGMTPIAIGSQTLGSTLRPAAYCGVLGFKPSFGSISRFGAMPAHPALDHVGLMAHSVTDLKLLCSVLAIADPRDPDCRGNPALHAVDSNHLAHSPRFALWKTPFWDAIEPEAQQQFLSSCEVIQKSGGTIDSLDLPSEFASAFEATLAMMQVGLAFYHGQDADFQRDYLSPAMQTHLHHGKQHRAVDYLKILQQRDRYRAILAEVFAQYDAILTPVTTGTAPLNSEGTGSPMFCALWTLCGLPAISIPTGQAANGLPLAIQLVGGFYQDRSLLQVADWVLHYLSQSPSIPGYESR